jgi:futalosine hydrolase
MILVTCALPQELLGYIAPPGVEIAACGVGPVEAACDTARRLASGRYSLAINVGIGGVFRGCGSVGDAFVIVEERMADLGREGDEPLTLPGGYSLVDRVRANDGAVARCTGLDARFGVGVTVAQVTATRATAERLRARYGADVETMEGFPFLRAAELAGVPALELRGISNIVDEHAAREWDFRAGARAAVAILEAALARFATASA